MKKHTWLFLVIALMGALAIPARANLILFDATLNGAQEPSVSTATGFGTVLLDDVADTITVDENWTGLIGGPATASHIHGPAGPGVNGPVIFPFSGVPNTTSGIIPEQTFSITLAQIADLEAGLYYFNIHDAEFPGGEIRGQIYRASVPDGGPGVVEVLAIAALCLIAFVRDRRVIVGN
jgi:hypothetical protein